MTGDRTLDDFVAGRTDGSEAAEEPAEGEETGAAEEADEVEEAGASSESTEAGEPNGEAVDAPLDTSADPGAEPAAAEPAVSTYRWSADGSPCDDCGETVERRWLDDGDYVCAACKEW